MQVQDILIFENGTGGDININANDIEMITGYENLPYLSMFSGSGNWWGNAFLPSDNQFISNTEMALRENSLSSSGLQLITESIKQDLQAVTAITGTTYKLDIRIVAPQRLSIYIDINGEKFNYYWTPAGLFKDYKI